MTIVAVDPGPLYSAYVVYDDGGILAHGRVLNPAMLDDLKAAGGGDTHLAVEMIASYGMPVGAEVFETCVWIGRYIEAWGGDKYSMVYRKAVKLHLCGSPRAKDSNIRQALIDRFGGPSAIGKKATPGPLYGIKADTWAALSVAVFYSDTKSSTGGGSVGSI